MTARAPAADAVATPWMTVTQVATYARRHPDTVYDALHDWVSSSGRRGLRGSQRGARCKWDIHRDDVDAWVRDEKPVSRRLRRAS